ncbi:MAG: corrinoid protein [Clostridia bacterium]|nr:corrinoid protein [Clostridia bacterium]MBR5257857.1 corrinoid protein [Clostridia bacterium]MBR5985463.1 corrinoid protein [Clostridia bacterium]MBR6008111.1 corrinoid protein [Clostridia bacterium]
MADLKAISQAVMDGRKKIVEQLVNEALAEGVSASEVLNDGLVAGMTELGELFKNGEVYVPEVLVAARAMKAGTAILKPLLQADNVQSLGTVAIGTVEGDLHDIGKNLVGMMLEGVGFTVMDLGENVSPDSFVNAAKQGANIIGMSALLTTTMPMMATTIKALEDAGVRDKVKVMIGGAPVTQDYADQIGADGYSADAASAAELAKRLIAC